MGFDIEPDDEWKQILKARIQSDLQSMASEVRQQSLADLHKSDAGPDDRKRLAADYKARLTTIKESAVEQYNMELEKERNKRRWMAGEPMHPGWSQSIAEEQQHAFDSLKHSRDMPVSPTHLQATFRSLSRASMRAPSPGLFPDADFEPDEEWKQQRIARIRLGFQPKVQHAKDKKDLELHKSMLTPEDRKRIEDEYDARMANIDALSKDEYNFELEKERNKRRERHIHGDKGDQPVPEDIPWTTKSYSIDGESLLKPPIRAPVRRESSASAQAARDSILEPDDKWKEKLHARIEAELKDKVRSLNDAHFARLRQVADQFAAIEQEHKTAMDQIEEMTRSRYESELARERLRRRGISDTNDADKEESSESGESGEDDEVDGDDNVFDDEEIDPSVESEKEKHERLARQSEEADIREREIRIREWNIARREIEAKKKAAEAKLVNDDDIDAIKKSLKEERVKFKDLEPEEEDEHPADADLEPVPPPEDGEPKPASSASDAAATSGLQKARRKAEAIEEQFRDYENDLLNDDIFEDPNPKWIEEQSYIWQQLQYQQQADMIQRKRQEQRARHDSMGSGSGDGGSYGSYSPGSSPVTSRMHMAPPAPMPVIPQMPPVNRSHVPVTPWAPVSSLSLATAAANKAAAVPPSPTIPRKPSLLGPIAGNLGGSAPMGIPKPRTGSISTGSFDHPGPSPSPRNVHVVVPTVSLP